MAKHKILKIVYILECLLFTFDDLIKNKVN